MWRLARAILGDRPLDVVPSPADTQVAWCGRSFTKSSQSGNAMRKGSAPSTRNSVRQSETEMIQPESGCVMMEEMARFAIQKA